MANAAGIANSFKTELLQGVHVLNTQGSGISRSSTVADSLKAALYTTGGSLSNATTAYLTTGELAGVTGYTAGGLTTTGSYVSLDTATAIWQPGAAITWSGITFNSVDAVLFYNFTAANKAIGVYTFSSQSITAGTFTLTMPTAVAASALLRIS